MRNTLLWLKDVNILAIENRQAITNDVIEVKIEYIGTKFKQI